MEENKSKLPYLIIVAIAIIAIIALIIIKISVPTFKLGTMLLIAAGTIIVLTGIGLAVRFMVLKNGGPLEDIKLPSAITVDEAIQVCKNEIEKVDFLDYTYVEKYETEKLGKGTKSSIFTCYLIGQYESPKYVVVLNMHYPTKNISVLVAPKEKDIIRAKIYASDSPMEEPTIKRVFSKNPLMGTEVITEEVSKPEEKKEEPKEKDI